MSKTSAHRFCPVCGDAIVWFHNSSEVGSQGNARCSNSPESSTFDLIAGGITRDYCNWIGITVRKPDGAIEVVTKKEE